jgi:hypothetical protein
MATWMWPEGGAKVNIQPASDLSAAPIKAWMKKFAWALPLFFLIKGLLWLLIPAISAVYLFD